MIVALGSVGPTSSGRLLSMTPSLSGAPETGLVIPAWNELPLSNCATWIDRVSRMGFVHGIGFSGTVERFGDGLIGRGRSSCVAGTLDLQLNLEFHATL